MKPIINSACKYTSIILAVLLTGFVMSCNKIANPSPEHMSAQVGSSAFTGKFCSSYIGWNRLTGDTLILRGYNAAGKYHETELYPQIKLCMWGINGVGAHAIGGTSPNTAFYITGPGAAVQAVDGSIELSATPGPQLGTSPDFFKGTFHFTCANGTSVQNGSFYCRGIVQGDE